jgi:hypothetical protein
MKQRAHAWVALRAYKLLDDSKQTQKLVELLSYYLSDVWDGAWLPDTQIGDMAYGHIYKMDSDPNMMNLKEISDRFKQDYKTLKSKLVGNRLCLTYVKDSVELDKPYCSDLNKGGHLPDRVIALSHTIADMLKLSDYPITFYAKGEVSKEYKKDLSEQTVKSLSLSPNFSARQIALMFFIQCHYICDAHMPLHCDLRDYGSPNSKTRRLSKDLHPTIEETWEEFFPDKSAVELHDYMTTSIDKVVTTLPKNSLIEIDSNKNYTLDSSINKLKADTWSEMVEITRTAYAVSRKWIDKSYKNADEFSKVPETKEYKDNFKKVTNYIFHDAVESTARIWLNTWETFIK